MTTELQTIDTDALVTATGGAVGGASSYGHGHHPFLALNNTLQTTVAQNQQNQSSQLMTVAMLGLALRNRD